MRSCYIFQFLTGCLSDTLRNEWMQLQTERQANTRTKGRTNTPAGIRWAMSCWDVATEINVLLGRRKKTLPELFSTLKVTFKEFDDDKEKKEEEEDDEHLRKKNMKLQPYLDFWDSEIEMDFSCPACVLLWCLSVPLCNFPLFLCLSFSASLLLKQPKQAAILFVLSFLPRCPFYPPSPYAMFSIFWNVNVLLVDTVHEW